MVWRRRGGSRPVTIPRCPILGSLSLALRKIKHHQNFCLRQTFWPVVVSRVEELPKFVCSYEEGGNQAFPGDRAPLFSAGLFKDTERGLGGACGLGIHPTVPLRVSRDTRSHHAPFYRAAPRRPRPPPCPTAVFFHYSSPHSPGLRGGSRWSRDGGTRRSILDGKREREEGHGVQNSIGGRRAWRGSNPWSAPTIFGRRKHMCGQPAGGGGQGAGG